MRTQSEFVVPSHLGELANALPLTLTAAEAAEVLHVSERQLRRMIRAGELCAYRRTGSGSSRIIVPRLEVLRHMAARRA